MPCAPMVGGAEGRGREPGALGLRKRAALKPRDAQVLLLRRFIVSGCWSEGELRASRDHELPSRDLEQVAAHIRACVRCSGLYEELSGAGVSRRGAARLSSRNLALAGFSTIVSPHALPPPMGCRCSRSGRHPQFRGYARARRLSPPPAPPPFVEPAARAVASLPTVSHQVASHW
jgi:hypothetical protein